MNGGIRGGTLGGLDLEPDLQTKKIIITAVFTAMDKMLDCMAIVDVVANIAFFLDLFSQPIMSVKVKQRKIE
jgi:hypothetical protein